MSGETVSADTNGKPVETNSKPTDVNGKSAEPNGKTAETNGRPHSGSIVQKLAHRLSLKARRVEEDIKDVFTAVTTNAPKKHASQCSDGAHDPADHRFNSFAPQRLGNEVKWYVDGCSYFWAVSLALEQAKESIWIMDWWLSPELYLRRPPAVNEEYRLDRMLQKAAERGVKIHVIVYKEVMQTLPNCSAHTKHALEALHPNITVFRHPDHKPDFKVLESDFLHLFQNLHLMPTGAANLPPEAKKALYGTRNDTVLYWAHHEKLCIIDGHLAFMGGLDLCFGRWDTNDHPIADVHPDNVDRLLFPGQDYNNVRIMDFQDVANWEENKLNRKYNARMGWTDMSVSLIGPVVEDLKAHFVQRWNFINYSKYFAKAKGVQQYIQFKASRVGIIPKDLRQEAGIEGFYKHKRLRQRLREEYEESRRKLAEEAEKLHEEYGSGGQYPSGMPGPMNCQILRSCSLWSHGGNTEHSIQDAYIGAIRTSKHFVYIENQFFISACSDKQDPVKNKLAAAIVERIKRADANNENYRMIIVIPAVPGYTGDLRTDESVTTRVILQFQYDTICRGGHSIYETLLEAGVDPHRYIRFYNLRSYDRINNTKVLKKVEEKSDVDYEEARKGHDEQYEGGQSIIPRDSHDHSEAAKEDIKKYQKYQSTARDLGDEKDSLVGQYDSVSSCYMTPHKSIRDIPWTGAPEAEIDAFVSEELYIHTKLLIADDRVVICGSANINDRSQLGTHDSEIAIAIEDPTPVDSVMAGKPYVAGRFASSLRRFNMRKHLGLVSPQDPQNRSGDTAYTPVTAHAPNGYDWDSEMDKLVQDPLSMDFALLWDGTARNNAAAFERVFHCVPTDRVRNWKEYDMFYERFFAASSPSDMKKTTDKSGKSLDPDRPSTWKYGHVVAETFPGGVEEVKKVLALIKGTLTTMPLDFLKDEDLAKEGMALNHFTAEIYT